MKGVFSKWIIREGLDDIFGHGVQALRHPDLAAISSFADNARETFPDEPAIEALQIFVTRSKMTNAQLDILTDTPYHSTTSKDQVYEADLRNRDAKILSKLVGTDQDGNWGRRYGRNSHKECLMFVPKYGTGMGDPLYLSPPEIGERWFSFKRRQGRSSTSTVAEVSVEYVARVMYELGLANFCHALAGAWYFRFGNGFDIETI